MDLNEVRVFVKVVQAGSFKQAAKQLGMPNSTASAKVSALERRLGVTLLQRTTRKLHLTEQGERYFRRCLRGLDEILGAEAEASSAQQGVQGHLRVTAPVDLGSTCLTGLISAFRKKFPQVSVELILSDQIKDLVAEGIDVAIRAGNLSDSGLIAKKLGVALWVPFASPQYLKSAGTPRHPKELGSHACLQFTPFGDGPWELSSGRSTVKLPVTRQIGGNDVNLLKALIMEGNGIGLLPTFACHTELKQGKLVRVLPEWRAYLDPVHLVYPAQRFVAPKVRAFVDVAVEDFGWLFKE